MRTKKYSTESLIKSFESRKILSYKSIAAILGTSVKMTILRKMKTLNYCASYSHAGRFYILKRFINFDTNGLWNRDSIYFSQYGSLVQTIPALVKFSSKGYFASELKDILQIKVHNTLAKLYREKILDRHQIRREYLYVHPDFNDDQLSNREQELFNKHTESKDDFPDSIAEHIRFLVSILTEQQSRLYLGFESLQFGHGGDVALSRITGVNVKTIAKGRQELEQKVNSERIRNAGAGRPSIKKKLK
jgi:hypothetical protein